VYLPSSDSLRETIKHLRTDRSGTLIEGWVAKIERDSYGRLGWALRIQIEITHGVRQSLFLRIWNAVVSFVCLEH
jgi:hypothetical protein